MTRIVNGVSDEQAAYAAQVAQEGIAQLQQEDRKRFYDVSVQCDDMVERIAAIEGEAARESAQRVAAKTLRGIFSRPGDDEPGARLQRNRPGSIEVHTHPREAPSLRQIVTKNRNRAEAEKRDRQKQGDPIGDIEA